MATPIQQTAQIVSISTAFLLAGYMTSASQNSLPILYSQPASISTPIFARVYYRGAALVVPVSIISAASSAYLAFTLPQQRTLYGAAGGVTLLMLPWTAATMMTGIHRLIDVSKGPAAEQEKAGQSGEVEGLLKAWTGQNWVRAGMGFAGGVVGLWAVMSAKH